MYRSTWRSIVGSFERYMSTTSYREEAADKSEHIKDVTTELSDFAVDAIIYEAAAASELAAIASANSNLPARALQYLIAEVHSLTRTHNWWLSIALTTLGIHAVTFPLLIYQHKAMAKFTLSLQQVVDTLVEVEQMVKGLKREGLNEARKKLVVMSKE